MPYIDLNKAQLYYEDDGVGTETRVFAHSMLFNLRMFDDQVEFLKYNYRCVRFDFRGQGKSEITQDGYDLDTLTDDVAELIQALDCKPCHFVGFSMGGMVAIRLAIRYPELLKSLILIDTTSELEPQENMLRNKLLLWVVKYVGLRAVAGQIMSLFFGASFLNDPKRKPLRKLWKNHFLANNRRAIIKVVKEVIGRDAMTAYLHKIKLPTLILVGEKDTLTDEKKAEIIRSGIEKSTLMSIPRGAHMTPVEEPDIVNAMTQSFLERITDG